MPRKKRTKRYGDYRNMPKQLLFRCSRIFCEVCNARYGQIVVNKSFLTVKQCLDHIFPVRLLSFMKMDPHLEVNILSVCGTCHGKKLPFEDKLFRGDSASFIQGLNQIGYPMERVRAAAEFYGFVGATKFIPKEQAEKEFLALTEKER